MNPSIGAISKWKYVLLLKLLCTTGRDLVSYQYHPKLATIDSKLKGTILNLLTKTGNHMNTICDLSTPLPLGAILLAININQKLTTIDPKLKGTILNLFCRTGNHTNTIHDLSTPISLGVIS